MDDKITVEFEQDALDSLAHRAEAHGRDIAAEVRSIVLEQIAPPPRDIDWIGRARTIRAMTPPGSIKVASWKLIRASRDWDH